MITKAEAWEWWVLAGSVALSRAIGGASVNPPSPRVTAREMRGPEWHDWSTPTPEQIDPDVRERFERAWAIYERDTCFICRAAADPNSSGLAEWMNPDTGGACPKHGKRDHNDEDGA